MHTHTYKHTHSHPEVQIEHAEVCVCVCVSVGVCAALCPPTAGLEAKLFLSQGSRVLTSKPLITRGEGELENEMERVGGGRFKGR